MRGVPALVRGLLAVLLVVVSGALVAPSASAVPYCGIRWGSLSKEAAQTVTASLVNVRAGRHACFDRLVLDFTGPMNGYTVRYVPVVGMDGSGEVVPLRGGAKLMVVANGPAYDPETGLATFDPFNPRELVAVYGWRTFRQIAWAGSFEGQTTLGVGVRARLPFRVFVLAGPADGSRLVVDVAHRW